MLLVIVQLISITTAFATSVTESEQTDGNTEAQFRNFFSDEEYQNCLEKTAQGKQEGIAWCTFLGGFILLDISLHT